MSEALLDLNKIRPFVIHRQPDEVSAGASGNRSSPGHAGPSSDGAASLTVKKEKLASKKRKEADKKPVVVLDEEEDIAVCLSAAETFEPG